MWFLLSRWGCRGFVGGYVMWFLLSRWGCRGFVGGYVMWILLSPWGCRGFVGGYVMWFLLSPWGCRGFVGGYVMWFLLSRWGCRGFVGGYVMWFLRSPWGCRGFMGGAGSRIPGFTLSDTAGSLLLITQVRRDNLKGALSMLKGMLQADQVPTQLAVTRLVQALGMKGDVESIQAVESMIKSLGQSINLSHMLFINNTAIAHIKKDSVTSSQNALMAGALSMLKGMLQADQVPTQLAVTRLVQALGMKGDVESIQAVESMIKSLGQSINLSRMLFINNTAVAHIKK
ncbi:UNVERIFIED_CONTAM: hypothetical protein FKN15_010626 [Acipenser sinensis]